MIYLSTLLNGNELSFFFKVKHFAANPPNQNVVIKVIQNSWTDRNMVQEKTEENVSITASGYLR